VRRGPYPGGVVWRGFLGNKTEGNRLTKGKHLFKQCLKKKMGEKRKKMKKKSLDQAISK